VTTTAAPAAAAPTAAMPTTRPVERPPPPAPAVAAPVPAAAPAAPAAAPAAAAPATAGTTPVEANPTGTAAAPSGAWSSTDADPSEPATSLPSHATAVAAMRELEAEGVLEKRQTPIRLSASPADFDAYVLSELRRWDKIIKDNQVKID